MIELFSNMIVRGYVVTHPKKGLRITAALVLLHGSLIREKRGALGEKNRESRHTDLLHAILNIATTARVGDFPHTLT